MIKYTHNLTAGANPMDNIDKSILEILQNNARISVSDLSSKINLSVSATAERIKKLEKSDFTTKYAAILNPVKLDKQLLAQMLISLSHPDDIKNFLEYVNAQKDILECYYVAGDYDYILKVAVKNTGELETLLNQIKSVTGVVKTNTIIVLGTHKESHSVSI